MWIKKPTVYISTYDGGAKLRKLILLAVCMLFAVSSGLIYYLLFFAGHDKDRSVATPMPAADNRQVAGGYVPPIQLHFAKPFQIEMPLPMNQDWDHNVWTEAIASELGIQLTRMWKNDSVHYDLKLDLAREAKRLPDIFRLNGYQLSLMAAAGELEELTDYYAAFASSETKKQYAAEGGVALKSGMVDNKLYGLPNASSAIAGTGTPLLWIRTDWLEALNLPEPSTMQEVMEIARAFAAEDPDRNQHKDTVGLAFSSQFLADGISLSGIFNGYHAYVNAWIKEDNGKLVYGSLQQEVKKALFDLSQLYQAGALDPDFSLRSSSDIREMIHSGKVGMINSSHWFGQWLQPLKLADPHSEWKPFAIPSIDGQPARVGLLNPALEYYAVRKGYEYPEALVKLMNLFNEIMMGSRASQEAYDTFMYDADNPTINLWMFSPVANNDATDEAYRQLIAAYDYNDPTLITLMEAANIYRSWKAYETGDTSKYSWSFHYPAWKILFGIMDHGQFVRTEFHGALPPALGQKLAILKELELTVFTKIIMGSEPIAFFDEFVQQWYMSGGKEITEAVNRWYEDN